MKRLLFLSVVAFEISLAATPFTAWAESAPAEQISAATAKYKSEMDKINAREANRLVPVKAAYLKELEVLRDNGRRDGNLDAVTDAEAALKAAQDDAPPPPNKVLGLSLQRARLTYEKNRAPVLKDFDEPRKKLSGEYSNAFTDMEQRFTRASEIDGARLVRDARLSAPVGFTVDVLSAMNSNREDRGNLAIVKNGAGLSTPRSFPPPIEIEYTLMIESQVRLGYAADQIIFNWERNRNQLRIDGGPVSGQHRDDAGSLRTKQFVTIKQVVLPTGMTIFVDGQLRAQWTGDFSALNQSISLHPVDGSLTVKQITVKRL